MTATPATPEEQLKVVQDAIKRCRPLLPHWPDSKKIFELCDLVNNPQSIKGKVYSPLEVGTQLFLITLLARPVRELEPQAEGTLFELVLTVGGECAIWMRAPLEDIDDAYKHSFRILDDKELLGLIRSNPGLPQTIITRIQELLQKGVDYLQNLQLEYDVASLDVAAAAGELTGVPPLAA